MAPFTSRSRRAPAGLALVVAAATCFGSLTGGISPSTAAAAGPRIDLRVLVLTDGSPMVEALADRLGDEGVPFTKVNLNDSGRPQITKTYLTVPDIAGPHARFQGVILPTHSPAQLSATELGSLDTFERAFGVRQVSAYNYPTPDIGLNYPHHAGPMDGQGGTVTSAAQADGFGYLRGGVPFDDLDPQVTESYGYHATPLAAPAAGTSFQPVLTAPSPASGAASAVLGVFTKDGKEELVSTFAGNQYQQHIAYLAPGIIDWLTRGVRLGLNRNYFSVHADDVLLPDAKWSVEGNCTIGDGCDPQQYPENAPGATVRMTPADVTRLKSWQTANGIYIDLAYNGAGVGEYEAEHGTPDPLRAALRQDASQFRWINHTWEHPYLGCVQDNSTNPWRCATGPDGTIQYASRAAIKFQVQRNIRFASDNQIKINPRELVTGEHSGLKTLPQMTVDNPNLAPALTDTRITWIASDASREPAQRTLGPALTVPRHPMNIFYNVSTKVEETDEYNWIYTSRANGGSGLCEDNPQTSTCIAPLNPQTGFDTYIAPIEARIALQHTTTNDPRPHYAHQSNLADDGILYPVLDRTLGQYRSTYAANTPIVSPSMADAGVVLQRQARWAGSNGVTATLVGQTVQITNSQGTTVVPATMLTGTKRGATVFGESYAGRQSTWTTLNAGSRVNLTLPTASGYRVPSTWTTAAGATVLKTLRTSPKTVLTRVVRLPHASDRLAIVIRSR